MKAKTLNKLIKDYQKIFENLGFKINQDFKKDYLHIKRMATNGTKISFIKADKIKGLQENIKGFKLKPNDTDQREKYFQAVKPSKFLSSMIVQNPNKVNLFNTISEQFTKDFISNLKSKLVLFSGSDISKTYNSANVVGCMSRSCKSWFKVYDKTENLQLATLTDEAETVLIRSLLWHDKETNNYWLDNSYEQSAINGDNEVRKEYQKKLICQVLEHLINKHKDVLSFDFGCNFSNSLDAEVIQEIAKEFNITIYKDVKRKIITETHTDTEGKETERETARSKERILLKPLIPDFDYDDFDSFPYSDTFASIDRDDGQWHISDNSGDADYVCLRSTEGEDENDSGTYCECCEHRIPGDEYIHYSEI